MSEAEFHAAADALLDALQEALEMYVEDAGARIDGDADVEYSVRFFCVFVCLCVRSRWFRTHPLSPHQNNAKHTRNNNNN